MKRISLLLTLCLMLSSAFAGDVNATPAKLSVNKFMVKNFVKSLIIPGWGQWSNGHKGRAIVYITAEIGEIVGYQLRHNQGMDLESEFKIFADEHWSFEAWDAVSDDETACNDRYTRTHVMSTYIDLDGILQPVRDQHFYENISKYREFVCGWDDVDLMWEEIGKNYTPNKLKYIGMRTDSNDRYREARTFGTLILINHLISAFDAALGTNVTQFESTNYSGKFYINPLDANNSIGLEVKF
ncbi:MAG: hypothetical protein K9N35_09530 [Candidatus Marinimicrobia bacterium]|nr:hypothetical protein [Candidatus Neomarinimicrobiota bacterium]